MTSRRLTLLVLLVAVFFLLPSGVQFYADWLWFGEVGYQGVYARSLATQSTLWLTTFLVAFGVLTLNLRLAFRVLTRREIVMVTPEGPRAIVVDPARLRPVVTLVSAAGAVLVASIAAAQWETWLIYWNAAPFGKADPVLGYDVGFYVFQLPFWRWLHSLAILLLALTTIGVGLVYLGAGFLRLSAHRGIHLRPPASTHAAVLAACWLAIIAAGAWLAIPEMLTAPSGLITGATYVDVHANMPAAWVLVVVAALGVLLAAYQVTQERIWPLVTAFGLCVLVSIGGAIYAAGLQRFVVAPNEQAREAPFIVHNIAATRDAFALQRVEERELSGDAALTRRDLDANAVTLSNVPLWDHQPLKDTFSQIQEIRTYYDFVSVDNDRYMINGEYRQIMLSARELNPESLPNRNWINEHFTFTHGYGLTLGPVNQVTREGLPTLFIRDLPPVSTVDLPVTEPSLYFGELSNNHVFVKTKTKEFHYPKGEDNVFTTYNGTGGVSVGSFGRKLLFALRFRSMKTLLSDDLTSESRILYHRRIADRVRLIAPFLEYDSRSVSGHRSGPAVLDPGRLHDQRPLSVCAAGRQHQLHPQQHQGRHRRLQRHHDLLRDRPARSDRGDARPRLPGPADAGREDARRPAPADALSADDLRDPGGDVLDVPHGSARRLLQQGRPVGGAGHRHARRRAAHGAVLRGDAPARRDARPSTSRCCRSRRARRTTWRRGWSRAATAIATAIWSSSSSRSRS